MAKEAIFVSRLLTELGIRLPESTITIQCDNTQTIQLINKEVSKLQTKLRHVDIHNHWLRQATKGTIAVTYVPSAEMLADGLTKALPSNKWSTFLEHLRLVESTEQRIPAEIQVEAINDQLEGLSVY